jgi:uncharacterized caspase-like protein
MEGLARLAKAAQPSFNPSTAAIEPPRPTAVGKRVALVIGNGRYINLPSLTNPANDAIDVGAALREMGFDVISGVDLSRRDMEIRIKEFSRKLAAAEVVMFYYAGHGLQKDGKNYLLPVDASIQRDGDLDFETIRLDQIQNQLEGDVAATLRQPAP